MVNSFQTSYVRIKLQCLNVFPEILFNRILAAYFKNFISLLINVALRLRLPFFVLTYFDYFIM